MQPLHFRFFQLLLLVQVAMSWADGRTSAQVSVHSSDALSEARIAVNEWAALTVRLWRGADDVELEWTVGPVPIADGVGKEVCLRLRSDVVTGTSLEKKRLSLASLRLTPQSSGLCQPQCW